MEALSGVDLPRGDGIKTRIPLVLKLREATDGEEFAELPQLGDDDRAPIRIELGQISEAIETRTTELAGDSKDIVDTPVEMTVYRKDQDDLTLIDLPGMTRVAVEGQHQDIEATITKMYRRYIAPEETIVLNVVSAMVDMSTSKALQLSRELDPSSQRTLLCITKVDQHTEPGLPDKIVAASRQLGLPMEQIFCVRNRSQQENEHAVPLAQIRATETEFFSSRSEFAGLPPGVKGTGPLSKHLVKLQIDRIAAAMPNTERKIRGRLVELQSEIDRLGDFPESEAACRTIIHPLLSTTLRTLLDQYTGRAEQLGNQTFGRMVQLELTIDDLSAEFKKTKGAEAGTAVKSSAALSSPEVEIEGLDGTKVGLDIYPCYVRTVFSGATKQFGVAAQCGVGALVRVTRGAGIKSVSLEYDLTAATSPGGPPVAEHLDRNRTWNDSDTEGYGTLALIKGPAACKMNYPVTFTAEIFVAKIEREHVEAAATLDSICAVLAQLDGSLERDLNGLYSNRYFFKPQLRKVIEAEMQHRRGATSGMPGAIMPEVAVAVLEQLRKPVLAILKSHVDAVATSIRSTVTAEISHGFETFPRLRDRLLAGVDVMFDVQTGRARAAVEDIMLWEDQAHTSNHYYMDTVAKVRESINDVKFVSDKASYVTTGEAKRMRTAISNEQQNLVEMQIQLFAYWKVMKKRLLDYVQMATRSALVGVPLRSLLHRRLQSEVEAAAGSPGLVALMAPDACRQQRYSLAKARQAQLSKAAAEMKAARSEIDNATTL